jgi:hypothetical protein
MYACLVGMSQIGRAWRQPSPLGKSLDVQRDSWKARCGQHCRYGADVVQGTDQRPLGRGNARGHDPSLVDQPIIADLFRPRRSPGSSYAFVTPSVVRHGCVWAP